MQHEEKIDGKDLEAPPNKLEEGAPPKLSFLDTYLSLWIIIACGIGLGLGQVSGGGIGPGFNARGFVTIPVVITISTTTIFITNTTTTTSTTRSSSSSNSSRLSSAPTVAMGFCPSCWWGRRASCA